MVPTKQIVLKVILMLQIWGAYEIDNSYNYYDSYLVSIDQYGNPSKLSIQ